MKCPDCEFNINTDNNIEGDIIACPCCGGEFRIEGKKLIPPEFEGEDWGE